MPRDEIEADFPLLGGREYELSDEDFSYNCLAFALGDQSHWWEPPMQPGQYWPPGFPDDVTIATVESIIRLHGFIIELEAVKTPETDAIAIYGLGNEWTHFAKFVDGSWCSKLGSGHDVSGIHLEDLEGQYYGKIAKILCRPAGSVMKPSLDSTTETSWQRLDPAFRTMLKVLKEDLLEAEQAHKTAPKIRKKRVKPPFSAT